jgi:hypothetical protein
MKLSWPRDRCRPRHAHDAEGTDLLNSLATGAPTLDHLREIIVRPSTEDDVAAMLAIYAHHIQRGLGAFDVEPLHGDDIKRRRKNMLKRRLPHLAAEQAGVVVGYAYAVPFRKRPAYRSDVPCQAAESHPPSLAAFIRGSCWMRCSCNGGGAALRRR